MAEGPSADTDPPLVMRAQTRGLPKSTFPWGVSPRSRQSRGPTYDTLGGGGKQEGRPRNMTRTIPWAEPGISLAQRNQGSRWASVISINVRLWTGDYLVPYHFLV